jgi:hypothetical protein
LIEGNNGHTVDYWQPNASARSARGVQILICGTLGKKAGQHGGTTISSPTRDRNCFGHMGVTACAQFDLQG